MQYSGQKTKQGLSRILHNMPCSWPCSAKLPEAQLHHLAYAQRLPLLKFLPRGEMLPPGSRLLPETYIQIEENAARAK